jgi:hypothetical protein
MKDGYKMRKNQADLFDNFEVQMTTLVLSITYFYRIP